MLAKLRQEIVRSHSRLTGHGLNSIVAEDTLQLLRRHRLVGPVADPGLYNMSKASALEPGDDACKAAGSGAPPPLIRVLAGA
jgi:hypothetical protein